MSMAKTRFNKHVQVQFGEAVEPLGSSTSRWRGVGMGYTQGVFAYPLSCHAGHEGRYAKYPSVGSAAVSRCRSSLPAPENLRFAPRPTPAREARDDLPPAHAVWRRPSGVSSSSPARALSPCDHLFSEFPWNAESEQATRTRHGGARRRRLDRIENALDCPP